MDMKLHEDAIHRGPAQVYPAIRESIKNSMMSAKPGILEPVQVMQFDSPAEYLGNLSGMIQNKRGQLINVDQQGEYISVKGKLPVAEMFGIASELRSVTSVRGSQYLVDQMFEPLPANLQNEVIKKIRTRKGLGENE